MRTGWTSRGKEEQLLACLEAQINSLEHTLKLYWTIPTQSLQTHVHPTHVHPEPVHSMCTGSMPTLLPSEVVALLINVSLSVSLTGTAIFVSTCILDPQVMNTRKIHPRGCKEEHMQTAEESLCLMKSVLIAITDKRWLIELKEAHKLHYL
jgi:hypothetical protein